MIHFTRVIFLGTRLSQWMSLKPFGNLRATGVGECAGGNWGTGGICDPGFGLSWQTALLGFTTNLFTQQSCACPYRAGIKTRLGERNSSKATARAPKFQLDSNRDRKCWRSSHATQRSDLQAHCAGIIGPLHLCRRAGMEQSPKISPNPQLQGWAHSHLHPLPFASLSASSGQAVKCSISISHRVGQFSPSCPWAGQAGVNPALRGWGGHLWHCWGSLLPSHPALPLPSHPCHLHQENKGPILTWGKK